MSGHVCAWCGEPEPNDMLLRNNHWVKWGPLPRWEYDWCREHGMCIGQNLVLNHLSNDLAKKAPSEQLRRTLAGAEAKWRIREDKPAILADARRVLDARERATTAPEPHVVAASEEVALW